MILISIQFDQRTDYSIADIFLLLPFVIYLY